MVRTGQYEKTVEIILKAQQIDPFLAPGSTGNVMAQALFHLGRHEEAIAAGRNCVQRAPTNINCRANLVAALGQSGDVSSARAEVAELLRLSPGFTIGEFRRSRTNFRKSEDIDRLADGLRRGGVPE